MSDAVIAAGVEFRSGPEADQVAAIANVEVRAASSHLGYPAPIS